MADRIQYRRDTAERWTQFNPILLEGEVGYIIDKKNQYKIGDGIHAWNDLPLQGFNGNIDLELSETSTNPVENRVVTQKISLINKLVNELDRLNGRNEVSADLDIIDEKGNVICRFRGGHIYTKIFNSENVKQIIIQNNQLKIR